MQLDEQHQAELLRFLHTDPHINLFLIGDIDLFGFDDTIQRYYGHYNADGNLVGVIFRFREETMHLYATQISDTFITQAYELYEQEAFPRIMAGSKTMALIGSRLDAIIGSKAASTMAVYTPNNLEIDTSEVSVLTSADADAIVALESQSFGVRVGAHDHVRTELHQGLRISYGWKIEGKLVSVATATAMTSDSAMIIGVCTDRDYMKQGFATKVVKRMSDELLKQGKQGVLFYTNPAAASIYERLGYEPYDTYYMCELKRSASHAKK
ncbi:GNAT family N-acetyltransferase [Erysipelothrix sp. HDW6C]|uniref:GNAT family N-acetyltransferase n=1 Tax=Erysipelothrix sp. HDW6C TaxID=2714930 RepID=UPI00140ABF97|nr:GNAT family N-acetyltransferase [Erysipelothrix sp. HDW6C]QIK69614.1 GNAT family N-acetyltransferase [Erysipelothrix sp. HDW6C]